MTTRTRSARAAARAIALNLILVAGCAPRGRTATDHHERHSAGRAQVSAASVRELAIPAADPNGPDVQASVLAEAPHKIVAIRLRSGKVLPEHASAATAIIQVAAGAGTVVIGDRRVDVDPTHFITLAPGTPHSVIARDAGELVLLVHHVPTHAGTDTRSNSPQ